MTAGPTPESDRTPSPSDSTTPRRPAANGVLVGLFVLATLVASAGGVVYFRGEAAEVYEDAAQEIALISRLKHRQLESWRMERLGDAEVLLSRNSQSASLASLIDGSADAQTAASVREWLGSYLYAYHQYDRAFLIAPDGAVRLTEPAASEPPAAALLQGAARAMRSREVEMLDFYRDEHDGRPHLGIVAPVLRGEVAIGAMVLRIDPVSELYTILEIEQDNSRTGETELVRREGEDVLFLNPLRFARDSALSLRASVSDTRRLAAMAVSGATGPVRGTDYRDAPVLGFIAPVAGSSWILVTRIDVAELDATLRSHLWLVTTGVLLVIVSSGATLGLWRHDQQMRAVAKQAELAFKLKDSEERLRLALSSAAQGLYDLDLVTGAVVVSPEYATMLGYDPETFVESFGGWEQRLHPEDRDAATSALREYLEGRTPTYRVEFRLRTAAGPWKWVLSVGQVVARHADGRPKRMLGTHTDIAQLKAAQEEHARAAAQLRRLLANSPTVVYNLQIVGGQLQPVAISDNVERILGYTTAEVVRPDFWETHVHPADRRLAEQRPVQLLTSDEDSQEYRFRRSDGAYIWVLDRVSVLRRDAAGMPVELAGAWNDITLRYEAELALRSSEERLRLAMASARQGLWDLSLDTGITTTSPEYAVMLGHEPGDFEESAAAWNARVHPDDFERCQAVFRDYLEGRRPDYVVEFRQRTKSGSWIWIHSTGRIVEWTRDGRPTRLLGIHTDITARKEAELSAARLSTLYLTLSRCNQAIVRSGSPEALFDEVCRATVDSGGFSMAWVGVVEPGTSTIRQAAAYGAQVGYLADLTLTTDPDTVAGQGPFGHAIRNRAPIWFDDVEAAAIESPLMDRIRSFGWAGMAAVPLMRGGEAVGALGIYSNVRGSFDPESRQLLTEMGANISFALEAFAREARRQEAEQRLRQSEARYRTLFADSGVPMLLIEPDTGQVTDANTAAAEFYGFEVSRLRRMHIAEIDTMPLPELEARVAPLVQMPRARFEATHRLASGEVREVEVFSAAVLVDDQRRILAIISDITLRHQAVAALVEKEFQLTEAQRIAHIGNWTRHSDGTGNWSDEMFRLYGLPVGTSTPGPTDMDHRIHPDDLELVQRTQQAHLRGESVDEVTFRTLGPDGSVRYLVERGERRTAPDGRAYAAGTVQDVTDRTNAELALQQGEERLRLALGAGRQGLWDLDLVSGTAVVSPPDPAAPGFTDGIASLTMPEFIAAFHPDDRERVGGEFRNYATGAVSAFESEFRLVLPDGQVRWVHSTGRVVERGADGTGRRVVGVATDITERHAFMEALRLRDRAIESSQNAVAIADLEGRITYVNRAFLETWEMANPAEAVGRNAVEFWEEPERPAAVIREMNLQQAPWTGELRALTATGLVRDMLTSAAFVTDEQNRPIGLVATFVDITDRKLFFQAMAASLREKEALLKEVHHRVKNNLQVISSLLRLELGRTAEPGVRLVLGEMQNRILSMALLHETLYRSDDLSRVDLSTYLNRLVQQLFRSSAPTSGRVTLQVTLAPAFVDLEQAVPCGLLVTELVSNSLKHAFPDNRSGEIRVTLAPVDDGPALRLIVADTGLGLPADLDAHRTQSLGLVLVGDLARQLRGTLTVAPGPGAAFTLDFTPRGGRPASGPSRDSD